MNETYPTVVRQAIFLTISILLCQAVGMRMLQDGLTPFIVAPVMFLLAVHGIGELLALRTDVAGRREASRFPRSAFLPR